MDYDWKCRDIAAVIVSCTCGGSRCNMRKGDHHRVNGVAPMEPRWAEHFPKGAVWLTFDSLETPEDCPGWPSHFFRKLRKATTDIFALADSKAPIKEGLDA